MSLLKMYFNPHTKGQADAGKLKGFVAIGKKRAGKAGARMSRAELDYKIGGWANLRFKQRKSAKVSLIGCAGDEFSNPNVLRDVAAFPEQGKRRASPLLTIKQDGQGEQDCDNNGFHFVSPFLTGFSTHILCLNIAVAGRKASGAYA